MFFEVRCKIIGRRKVVDIW